MTLSRVGLFWDNVETTPLETTIISSVFSVVIDGQTGREMVYRTPITNGKGDGQLNTDYNLNKASRMYKDQIKGNIITPAPER